MGYWVDTGRRLPDDGPRLHRVASGGRSSRSSTRACWSRTTGSRRTARAAAPACPTTSWPRATRTSSTRRSTCASRSPPARWPAARRCWCGRPRRGRWCPTRPSRCTRTSPTWSRRDGSEQLVVAEPLLEQVLGEGWTATGESFTGKELERWTVPPPFDLVEIAGRALRGPRRLRHHRGRHGPGAPGARVRRRRPRQLPARTACRWSTRPAGRHVRAARCRWSAACSSRPPTRRWSRTSPSAGCCSAHDAVRAQLPALLALPHAAALLRAAVLVHPHHRGQGRAAARERAHQLAPGDDQARPVRRLADQQRRLGAVRAAATGARRCRSGAAPRAT